MEKERPNFGPKQVRNVCEIKFGKNYRAHYGAGTRIITILQQVRDFRWVTCKVISDEPQYLKDMSLADCGVIPYESCEWNATNWLEKIGDVDNTIVSLENLKNRNTRILDTLMELRFEINETQEHIRSLIYCLKEK